MRDRFATLRSSLSSCVSARGRGIRSGPNNILAAGREGGGEPGQGRGVGAFERPVWDALGASHGRTPTACGRSMRSMNAEPHQESIKTRAEYRWGTKLRLRRAPDHDGRNRLVLWCADRRHRLTLLVAAALVMTVGRGERKTA